MCRLNKIRKTRGFVINLITSKQYATIINNAEIRADLRRPQANIHAWGRSSRVTFDPLKKRVRSGGGKRWWCVDFGLVGPLLHGQLLKHECIDRSSRKAKTKARALVRCRRLFSMTGYFGPVQIAHAEPRGITQRRDIPRFHCETSALIFRQCFCCGVWNTWEYSFL